MKLWRSILKYIVLIAFGVLLGIGVLELGVRLVLGAKPETYLREFSQYHALLGWEKKPGQTGYFRRGDAQIFEQINSHGQRDREYSVVKPGNTYRILVIGDSFTEGYDVNSADVFTEILEVELNRRNRSQTFEVINAGTGGYSTDQEFLYFTSEGAQFQPDLVILMMYPANDIYYNIMPMYGNYHKPLFTQVNDSLRLTNVPLPMPSASESAKGVLRHLALYPIVMKLILTEMPSTTRLLHKLGWVSTSTMEIATAELDSSTHYPPAFGIYARSESPEIQKAWNVTTLLLRDLKHRTGEIHSDLIVCAIPDKFEIYPDAWKRTQATYHVDDTIWDVDRARRRLRMMCDSLVIQYIDLADCLRQPGVPFYNGVHWNEAGNHAVADYLLSQITSVQP